MKFLWIISHGPTYWFEHTDQGDEDPLGSFLAFPSSFLYGLDPDLQFWMVAI